MPINVNSVTVCAIPRDNTVPIRVTIVNPSINKPNDVTQTPKNDKVRLNT